MNAPATGLYADLVSTTRAPLEIRLANALGEALDLLEEQGIAPASLLEVLGEAETRFARVRRAEMESRHV